MDPHAPHPDALTSAPTTLCVAVTLGAVFAGGVARMLGLGRRGKVR